MSTTVTLCFDNGLQFNPAIVHVEFGTGSHEGIEGNILKCQH
jgi:hypothetical protein